MRRLSFLTPLLRAFRWHRRWFAAIFAAIAVLAGLNAITSTGPEAHEVVVAARTIDAGTTLVGADLELTRLPAQAIPDGALSDPADLIGRTTKAATPGRRVLVEADLLGATAGVGAGRLALPVRFGESQAAALLSSGVRIDVLGPQPGGAGYQVVAADVRVITVVAPASSGPFGGSDSGPVLLEVDSGQAAAILAAASIGSISFALR